MTASEHPAISAVAVEAYTIPTDAPESDGTIEWDSTTIVVVEITAGSTNGLGYTYAPAATAGVIESLIADGLLGGDPMALPLLSARALAAVRNAGNRGVGASAVSAVDIALWDLKSKLLGLALVELIGAARTNIRVYGSGGFTSYDDETLAQQLGSWAHSGIDAVKMKIGREPGRDPVRVARAREAIGTQTELFVDANGAFSPREAVEIAARLDGESRIAWFEEPVSSDDRVGLRFVREHVPVGVAVAAGEYASNGYDFAGLIGDGCVDVVQADATRCQGITGFLRAAALCSAHGMRLSAHTAPTVHMHACCAAEPAVHLEYFHDHVRIESLLFDGFCAAESGSMNPDRSRPGLGIELCRKDAERFRSAR